MRQRTAVYRRAMRNTHLSAEELWYLDEIEIKTKPNKNQYFCPAYNGPKIQFESKSSALRFIEFNSQDIMEQKHIAPIRAYFCPSCACWHVTSKELKTQIL